MHFLHNFGCKPENQFPGIEGGVQRNFDVFQIISRKTQAEKLPVIIYLSFSFIKNLNSRFDRENLDDNAREQTLICLM